MKPKTKYIILGALILCGSIALAILSAPLFAPFVTFLITNGEANIPFTGFPNPNVENPMAYSLDYSLALIDAGRFSTLLVLFLASVAIFVGIAVYFAMTQNPNREVSEGVLGDAKLLDSKRDRARGNVLWDGEGDAPGPSLVFGYERGMMVGDPAFAHGWVDAKSGCGKSRSIGYPSLFWNVKAGASIIYTARKLTDYKLTAKAIEGFGVRTFLLDLEVPKRGCRFNLMDAINAFVAQGNVAAAQRSARQLAADFIKHDARNPYFSSAARGLLTAAILIVALSDASPEQKNLASVAKVVRSGMTGAGNDPAAPLKDYIRSLGPDSAPYKAAAEFLQDNGSTAGRNVASTLMTGIAILSDEGIEWMLSGSDFTLRELVERQCVLFPHCLGEGDPYNAILAAMYNQLWTTLQQVANENGEKLPHPFVILGDEWGNLPRVESLGEMVALGRSMDVHVFVFVQNLAQLNKYNDEGDNGAGVDKVLGSMNLQIAMSVMKTDPDGRYFSDLIGKRTILTRSDSRQRSGFLGGRATQGQSLNEQQVDLIPPYAFKDRVPLRDGIIVVKGGENDAPGREGVFRMPIVDATKIKPVRAFFGLGTKAQDTARCAQVEAELQHRVLTVDPFIPLWCPDFSATETEGTRQGDIAYDEGLEWD